MLPFLLFAFVASITPGPTNLLVLGTGTRHGPLAALPLVIGAAGGAAAIVLATGMGLGDLLLRYPDVQRLMAWVGVAWLTWLAWRIFSAPATAVTPEAPTATRRPGFLAGALLQLVNPKTWMMALAVVGVFAGPGTQRAGDVPHLAAAFFLVALPCLGAWALLGAGAASLFRSARAMKRFEQAMAVLLFASAWLSLPT